MWIKSLQFIFAVIASSLICISIHLIPNEKKRLHFKARLLQLTCQTCLKIFKIEVQLKSEKNSKKTTPVFIVSNHLSYIDVLIISACYPSLFVTSTDTLAIPFIGTITRFFGCIFVNRKKPYQIKKEIRSIHHLLDLGLNVVVFPEATSSNGDSVLPFRSALFEALKGTSAHILPLKITYKNINGDPLHSLNRDRICYYGEMEFFPHLKQFLRLKSISAELEVRTPLEVLPHDTRTTLRDAAYHQIQAASCI